MRTPLKDARHERFAQSVAGGAKVGAAFIAEYPNSSKKRASEGGSRLARKPQVAARIQFFRQEVTKECAKAAQKGIQEAAKAISRRLMTMHDRRALMSEIMDDPKNEPETRMKAAMNDAKLAGELIDKQDLTTDGEALPTVMPSINLQMPSSFLARRGHSAS